MSATDITDVVGTANIRDTLTLDEADAALWTVLRHGPQLLGVEEWDDGLTHLTKLLEHTGWKAIRPHVGGSPIVYASKRYMLLNCYGVELHKAGFVGDLPGRKSTLPASLASVGIFEDLILGGTTALVVVHLTAEVQKGAGYRLDLRHARRVLRHRLERRNLRLLVLGLRREGHRVYVVGDTNYDSMPLHPLASCWSTHADEEQAGTLGSRTVDYVYAPEAAASVVVIPTRSDHDAVVATYPR